MHPSRVLWVVYVHVSVMRMGSATWWWWGIMEIMAVVILTRFVLIGIKHRGVRMAHLVDDIFIVDPMRTYLHSLVLLPWFI